jgi:transposase
MDAILLVLRTGMAWNALKVTGPCSPTTAHTRFSEWIEAGVFRNMWVMGLMEYDRMKQIDWEWLSMDGAMTKAPLGGEKGGSEPHRPRQRRRKTKRPV